jgi:RimJ/RimL family protein N-acetyltransferase
LKRPEILTQRLRLFALIASDVLAMYKYRANPEVYRYQSFEPGSVDDVEEFIGGLSTALDTPGSWFQFAIRLQESGLLIGDLGTHFMADDPHQVEIGFIVAPIYQG